MTYILAYIVLSHLIFGYLLIKYLPASRIEFNRVYAMSFVYLFYSIYPNICWLNIQSYLYKFFSSISNFNEEVRNAIYTCHFNVYSDTI